MLKNVLASPLHTGRKKKLCFCKDPTPLQTVIILLYFNSNIIPNTDVVNIKIFEHNVFCTHLY